MLKLFKSKKEIKNSIFNQDVIISELPKIANSLYPKEVLEIHHEFECAADKLLEEANKIISEAGTKDVQKVSRLESLGFKQASQVVELKPLIQKAELSKEQINLVAYYKREYSLNKFITEEQVKTICHKYNLVHGDVDRFKGFVPEKNLREIENFKLKENDFQYFRNHRFSNNDSIISKKTYEYLKNSNDSYSVYKKEINLSICAPIKDMNTSGLELSEGYKLQAKIIPDPVVLQSVKGGYLILTAWGDEASDPIVVNNKMN